MLRHCFLRQAKSGVTIFSRNCRALTITAPLSTSKTICSNHVKKSTNLSQKTDKNLIRVDDKGPVEPVLVRCIETEREEIIHKSEQHMDKITIDGIPLHIPDDQLKDEVMKVFEFIDALIAKDEIQSASRVGNKARVCVKFHDLYSRNQALINSRKLANKLAYGNVRLYINQSLCEEMEDIQYWLRKAQREGKVHKYDCHNSIMRVKEHEHSHFKEVTHLNDLVELGLQTEHPEDSFQAKQKLFEKRRKKPREIDAGLV